MRRQHHHHLRAFASAFGGGRSPFFDPRLVEWEQQLRRKTAEQWAALDLPRRMGHTGDLSQTFNFAPGDHPHWLAYNAHYSPYFTSAALRGGAFGGYAIDSAFTATTTSNQDTHLSLLTDPNTSPDQTTPSDTLTTQLPHPSSAFTFKSLLDNLGQSKTAPCRPLASPPSSTSASTSDDTKSPTSNNTTKTNNTLPIIPPSSTLSATNYLLASQNYYSANGTAGQPGMYGLVPLYHPQLYQQGHLHQLGARGSYLQQMATKSDIIHSNAKESSCADETRSDGGTDGLSARERLEAVRALPSHQQQRTAQSEVASVWRPY
ncbi:hypothetical protein JTE90_001937 [Oedothorax gibbosus]|uniref:Uncharacterized protein n=1 Tax=Oedothorax gibbosus TaxID=931172 RepID=A0AAV6VX50_9ARAC|nr:hypothetical protein JTE90_001937 [Oedothorax gibbosus]